MRAPILCACLSLLSSAVTAQAASTDSAAVAAAVTEFHAALAAGDSSRALSLLAPDVMILEAGGIETLSDYRSHHLPGDIRFAQTVPATRGASRVTVHGDIAWVVTASTTTGTIDGRTINSAGAELMVLARDSSGWRIRAIHWSSRRRSP